MKSNIKIITIEGNIGSGKSTLLKELETMTFNKPHILLMEQVDDWLELKDNQGENIFCLFYSNPKLYSYVFQTFVLLSRLQLLLKTIKENEDIYIICERCHLTDLKVFAKSLYEMNDLKDIEWKVYQKWHKVVLDMFEIEISAIVYNRADPSICLERIQTRSRNGESTISLTYLDQIHTKHEEWLVSNESNIPTLIINGNVDLLQEERGKQLYKIKEFINNL